MAEASAAMQGREVMTTSQRGIDLIKEFEGLRLKVYLCPGNIPTIGYGHTKDVTMATLPITEEQAEAFLVEDLRFFEDGIEKCVKVPLNPNQHAALVSFTFNLGLGSLQKSTLLKRLNESKYTDAAAEFEKWVFAGGKAMPGLRRRRVRERRLFEEPYEPVA